MPRNLTTSQKEILRTVDRTNRRILWFHAASVGEYEQARILARRWKEREPEVFLVFSVFSHSGYSQRKEDTLPDIFFALPFDFSAIMSRLADRIRPEKVFYARYDVWPNMALRLSHRNIPQYIISAQMSPRSLRLKKPFDFFYKNIYGIISHIFTVDTENMDRFLRLAPSVSVAGDTRFDAIEARINDQTLSAQISTIQKVKSCAGHRKILVAGSSYMESEIMIAGTMSKPENREKFLNIFFPHHINPDHLDKIMEMLREAGLSFILLSQMELNQYEGCRNKNIIIVDTMGLLTQGYSIADLAYVGGGFEGSVHTVIEPVFFGIPVITGHHIENSTEAMELAKMGLIHPLSRPYPEDFQVAMKHCLDKKQWINTRMRQYFNSKKNAVNSILEYLQV